ncbi:proline-rich protein 36-like [Battus philenor]|uniref:proline-rich protein 36-like n=1 Tax=Battus philenor TaxID=42288 RepID=UPI0035CF2AEF
MCSRPRVRAPPRALVRPHVRPRRRAHAPPRRQAPSHFLLRLRVRVPRHAAAAQRVRAPRRSRDAPRARATRRAPRPAPPPVPPLAPPPVPPLAPPLAPSLTLPHVPPFASPFALPLAPPCAPPSQPEWSSGEDAALRRALRLQRWPAYTYGARTPNWEWAAELVSDVTPAYRSPDTCRDRSNLLELDDTVRPLLRRADALRAASERRRAAPPRPRDPSPPHMFSNRALLAVDYDIDYHAPPTPMEIASRRDRSRAPTHSAAPLGADQQVVLATVVFQVVAPRGHRR